MLCIAIRIYSSVPKDRLQTMFVIININNYVYSINQELVLVNVIFKRKIFKSYSKILRLHFVYKMIDSDTKSKKVLNPIT